MEEYKIYFIVLHICGLLVYTMPMEAPDLRKKSETQLVLQSDSNIVRELPSQQFPIDDNLKPGKRESCCIGYSEPFGLFSHKTVDSDTSARVVDKRKSKVANGNNPANFATKSDSPHYQMTTRSENVGKIGTPVSIKKLKKNQSDSKKTKETIDPEQREFEERKAEVGYKIMVANVAASVFLFSYAIAAYIM